MAVEVTRSMLWRTRASRAVSGVSDATTGWLLLTVLIAASPGVAAFAIQSPSAWGSFVGTNLATLDVRAELFGRIIGSAIVVLAIYAWSIGYDRARGATIGEAARSLNKRFAFLLAPMLLSPLFADGFVRAHPFLTIVLTLGAALACGVSAAQIEGRPRLSPRVLTAIFAVIVAAAAVYYVSQIVRLQLAQHHAFRTQTYDLGIYVNCVWKTLHGDFLGSSFLRGGTHASAHFDPILALVGPTFFIHEGAESLFFFQAILIASGAAPVFILARVKGGPVFGAALALAYLAHPVVHGINLNEFHSMALGMPLLLWSACFLERRIWIGYTIALALLLTAREDMSVAAGCMGLYAIVCLRETRAGVLTILAAVVYFACAKLFGMTQPEVFMPDTPTSYEYASYFRDVAPDGQGKTGVLGTFLANPGFLLRHVAAEQRVLFSLQLIAPLALLPLLGGRRWIAGAYGLILILLASRPPVYTIGYHYASVLVPACFILAPHAIDALARRLERAYTVTPSRIWAACGAAILLSSAVLGLAFGAPSRSFTTGAAAWPLVRELSPDQEARYREFLRLTADIEDDEMVAASALVMPHLADRERIHELTNLEDADWVVAVDEMITGAERPFWNQVRRDPRFTLVGSHGTMHVYRRR
jgi:uncharacterized membrane protein